MAAWADADPRRFLIRNRVIGALSRGTVVVEAGMRSGALNTARHARDLGRPLMAVPGPVTSDVSAGCHRIIREWGAVCVTGAADVIEMLSPLGESGYRPQAAVPLPCPHGPLPSRRPCGRPRRAAGDPLIARDALDPLTEDVLEAIPARGARPATIAVAASVGVDAVVRSLGLLAAGGYVERCSRGWRIRPSPG